MAEELIQPANATATPVVEPAAGATPPPEEAAAQGAELPAELLQIPAFQALMAGVPPAVSADINTLGKTPEGKIISENAKSLSASGFGFYRALSGTQGIIFNQLYVTPEQIKAADEQNQLGQLAPEWNVVNDAAAKSGSANPALTAGPPPEGPPTPPAPPVPQMSAGSPMLPPPPASSQTKLAGARARNLQEGSPTSGRAAQGRLLNNLLKPAI